MRLQDLTQAQKHYLLRIGRCWPQFIPIGRVRVGTIKALKRKGYLTKDMALTMAGLSVALAFSSASFSRLTN